MTVRSVFIIGPDNKVKLTLTYPASTGRNFDELLRVIDSLQLTAKHSGRHAGRLEGRRGRDHRPVGQRRGREEEVPEGIRGQEAVPAGHAAAEQVTGSSPVHAPVASRQMNSPSTMAVAPHTWWPSRSKYGYSTATPSRTWCPAGCARRRADRAATPRESLPLPRATPGNPGRAIGDADNRVKSEPADQDVHRRQLTQDPDTRRIDADFLRRFAQRRFSQRLSRIGRAAGQADLAGCRARPLDLTVNATAGPAAPG